MILGTCVKLPIGHRGIGCSDTTGRYYHDQPFIVVREATAAEYLAETPLETLKPLQRRLIQAGLAFFYEVSLD